LEGTEKVDLKTDIKEMVANNIAITVEMSAIDYENPEKSVNRQIVDKFTTIIPFEDVSAGQIETQLEQLHSNQEKIEFLVKIADDMYEAREKQMGKELMHEIEKFVTLSVVDNLWMDHLDAIDNLRQGIGLRGYGQRDPLVEYKNEAFTMFEKLLAGIDDEVAHRIYRVQVQSQSPEMHQHQHQHVAANNPNASSVPSSTGFQNTTTVNTSSSVSDKKKLGRNDPCWCGSGKKYKKCHLPD